MKQTINRPALNSRPVGALGTPPLFRDRTDAGDALALVLSKFATEPDVIVLGLARGGIPIARRVADALGAPLGALVSRKIGVPGINEVALGAIAEGSHRVVADSVAWYIGVPSRIVEQLAARERVELERRAQMYRTARPVPDLRGRTVILVDDGLATGATLRAAARAIRKKRPKRLIAAVPVGSHAGATEVRSEVDNLVAVFTPNKFETVSSYYDDYSPVTEAEVLDLLGGPTSSAITDGGLSDVLRDVSDRIAPKWPREDKQHPDRERTLKIPVCDGSIMSDLGSPQHVSGLSDMPRSGGARGLVIVAHGGGSSRDSYRNRYIAGRLRLSGYATLRVDLLTEEEQRADTENASVRFDFARLTARLTNVCEWAAREGVDGAHRTILIGASTGAAAALATAAWRRARIFAVIARGGRVDLATDVLSRVRAPVLLIVGAADRETLQRNTEAMRSLPRGARLIRVPRAGHTFDEPRALGAVAEHAVKWLDRLDQRPWNHRGLVTA